MLFNKHNEVNKPCLEYMFDGQEILQQVLANTAIVCIPIMLLGKPIYVMLSRKGSKVNVCLNG